MGLGLRAQVGLDDDDDIQWVHELLVEQLSMPVMRTHSGVGVTSALGLFLLPFGRPGRRFPVGGFRFLASALALVAAFSASLRTTCSMRRGNERRAWVLTNDNVKKARPGTDLPYRLEKKRSRP